MPTAEPLPDNIRRIAVLVASVDSATARQLLLHLPTSVAKHVRRALQNLGPISAAERQRILTEFQTTAAKQNQVLANEAMAAPVAPLSKNSVEGGLNTNHIHKHSQADFSSLAEHSERYGSPLHPADTESISASQSASPESSQPSWKLMDIRALSHFLRGERATLIAVVINQLSPGTGVALLQQLPANTHREVLQAIANLQDIDNQAMQSIEEHLAERLKDYKQQVESESKGTRRVAALLAAAPPELQETWSRFVHIAFDSSQDSSTESPHSATLQASAPRVATRAPINSARPKQATAAAGSSEAPSLDGSLGSHLTAVDTELGGSSRQSLTDSNFDDDPYVLPFPRSNDAPPLSNTDRSLIQLEFEQILSLSAHQLAHVLTATDSQTVMLALAGASHTFMKRFYAMLTKADGKALASRLSKIGPLKLRDIDEAQRSIAELAAKMLLPPSHRTSHSQALRAVA